MKKITKGFLLAAALCATVGLASCNKDDEKEPTTSVVEESEIRDLFANGTITQNGNNEELELSFDSFFSEDKFKSSLTASMFTLNAPGKTVASVTREDDTTVILTLSGSLTDIITEDTKEYEVTVSKTAFVNGSKASAKFDIHREARVITKTLEELYQMRVNNTISTLDGDDLVVEGKVTFVDGDKFAIQDGKYAQMVYIDYSIRSDYKNIVVVGQVLKVRGRVSTAITNPDIEVEINSKAQYVKEISVIDKVVNVENVTITSEADYKNYCYSMVNEIELTITAREQAALIANGINGYVKLPYDLKKTVIGMIDAGQTVKVKVKGYYTYTTLRSYPGKYFVEFFDAEIVE